MSVDERAAIRTRVARQMFAAQFGRAALDPRELAGFIARESRPAATTVAGFDLTFSPPKSVSTLWAVASPRVAARIEAAHREAVAIALRFVEHSLLFTREGTNGVRQVNVQGLLAAAFTHRDSRAGDPDLHTHVAVANKVKASVSGKWLAIDGRVLYKGNVAASETYNTALVKLLERQGFGFEDRYTGRDNSRPVREIAGVSVELSARWSSRRADIEAYRQQLVAGFQDEHGRPPTVVESVKLAQQATLATRDGKHEPRTLAQQRAVWHRQAVEVLGGETGLVRMLAHVLAPHRRLLEKADAAWFEQAAERILAAVQERGATWQDAHLRAEALRQVRSCDLRIDQIGAAVELLVTMAKDLSISLAPPADRISEPAGLRRADGASVYTVAGSELFTSAAVLAAEQRLVDLAGTTGAHTAPSPSVSAAIASSAAQGHELTPSQAHLVTQMATSGARLQLALAAAGAGKTTAMRVLTTAWTSDGGSVLGLAPSAAAATQLRSQTGTTTDTLAKLVWGIQHHDLPDWARAIGPETLVVIDEAGMADTISLDTVCTWLAGRGAVIRLVGDDQQLAAIGAGGVLRDIKTRYGAISMTELMRFADPAEAAASLAIRDGDPAGLGFYLDNGRVHVGDQAGMAEQAFTAWRTDRDKGLDSVLLAPTRALVAQLNARARSERLAYLDQPPLWEALLADGNRASAGDVVISRTNDRSLRWSATDWVKNGDRWTVRQVSPAGDLRVEHLPTGRLVTLPHVYVTASVELGYACTIHAAQGVSCDTSHTVTTPGLSRQQLYTMVTRGRLANHIWLEVVTDGDDDTLIHPDAITPPTPTDLLERILARDDSPTSATSLLAHHSDPRLLLGEAARIYTDAVAAAAEHHLGPTTVAEIDAQAQELLPLISDEPAWPTLHAHLILLAAHGHNPITLLTHAISERDLTGAHDRAAVLAWRLDPTPPPDSSAPPLPWLPTIPVRLLDDPEYGPWLTRRRALVIDLAEQVKDQAMSAANLPGWVSAGARPPDTTTLVDVEVWRAATGVEPADRRPTGPVQVSRAGFDYQRELMSRLHDGHDPALTEWRDLLCGLQPSMARDPFIPRLAQHLAALSRTGLEIQHLLTTAASIAPLPDDHAASALWWRLTRLLTPDTLKTAHEQHQPGRWLPDLPHLLGQEAAQQLTDSPFWNTLASVIDDALERGHPLASLLHIAPVPPDMDPGLSLICQIATLTAGPPDQHDTPPEHFAPDDIDTVQTLPQPDRSPWPISPPRPSSWRSLQCCARS